MGEQSGLRDCELSCRVQAKDCNLAVSRRHGPGPALLYLPGLGCSRRDFAAAADARELESFNLVAIDHPGMGDSPYPENARLTLDDLAAVAHQAATALALDRPVLIGHSLGGVVALLYAERFPVSGLVSIEGNVRPENCVFSREAVKNTFEVFARDKVPAYLAQLRAHAQPALRRYAESFALAAPRALFDTGRSLVEYSDNGRMLERFCALQTPKCYVHGDENRTLSYLPELRRCDVRLVEIPESGHFPQHANPAALWPAVGRIIRLWTE